MPEGKKAAVPAPKPVREEDLYSAKTHLHQPVPVQETATVSATAQLADAPEGALPSEVRPEIVTWEKLCEAIKASGRSYNMEMIEKAYDLANTAHKGVCRRSGEPYICHPLAVARLVLDLGMDSESIAAALLHDVVDAALNLSVYDSPRGAQLSGRILDLHPAGLGTKLAEQAAFVAALRRGTPLTEEQKKLITPERSDIVTVYRELQARRWHAEDLQPLCAKLGEENTGKTLVAVTALEQVGLIAAVEKGGAKYLELVPAQGKKNLADAPILKCLEGM